MVEVFKTNVQEQAVAKQLVLKLQQLFPGSRANFDLEDCDNVLRVEGPGICPEKTITLLNTNGYNCGALV